MAGMSWNTGYDHPIYDNGGGNSGGVWGGNALQFSSKAGDPSEFGWTDLGNGNFQKGNYTMTAGEMAAQLPRWQAIKSGSNPDSYNSGVDYAKSITDTLGGTSNKYDTRLNALLDNPDSIKDTGAYKFSFDQGQQALERSAAAKGMTGSGNTLAELVKYGQGMASQQYNTEANRLAGLAGTENNYLLGKGQLALGAAKAKADDYFTGKQSANQFAINSGYGKQSVW